MTSSNPTGSGGRIPFARAMLVVAVIAGSVAVIATFLDRSTATNPDGTYSEIAQSTNLQIDLEHLPEEISWREYANVPDASQSQTPNWLTWLPWGAIGQLIFWGIIALIVIGLATVIYLLIRNVGLGRFASDEVNASRHASAEPLPTLKPRDSRPLTIPEILALTDLESAIGELQRSALAAATDMTGMSFKRSATAREALRKLPRDWRFRPALTELMREAEQVRFAGKTIVRERLEELVETSRPMIKQAGGAA